MRFAFTDDQLAFRDAVRDLLEKECPPSVVREAWTNADGRSGPAWTALAEMGVLGALVPEPAGGLGLTVLDVVLHRRGDRTGRAPRAVRRARARGRAHRRERRGRRRVSDDRGRRSVRPVRRLGGPAPDRRERSTRRRTSRRDARPAAVGRREPAALHRRPRASRSARSTPRSTTAPSTGARWAPPRSCSDSRPGCSTRRSNT